jgi:cation diffusion facilitator family transporter
VAAVTADCRICLLHDSGPSTETKERKVRIVVAITLAMMLAELAVGLASGSLALVAEAWHMGCHAGAIGLTALAYWFARTRAQHARFAFGTGKVHALSGFTNAILLIGIAVVTIAEGCKRFFEPVNVKLGEALPVAAVGLLVNLVCALLLQHDHDDAEHGRDDDDDDHEEAHDHNLRAAYLHVLGDVVVSIGAMAALIGIRFLGWTILDPLMAIVSSVVILRWGIGLSRTTAAQLLDMTRSDGVSGRIRERIEEFDDARVVDLHVWETGPGRTACILSLVTKSPRPLDAYRAAVQSAGRIEHVTVEIMTEDAHSRRNDRPEDT